MDKILEKLSNAVLISSGLGLILPFIIYACTAFSKWVPICPQLLLFHFFNTSVFIVVGTENRQIWECSVWLNWPIIFLNRRFVFSSLQPGSSSQVLNFRIIIPFFSDMTFYFDVSYEKKGNPHLHRSMTIAYNIKSFPCVSKCGRRWVFRHRSNMP